MEKVEAFKTADGRVFLTRLDAVRHESEQALSALVRVWLKEHRDDGRHQPEMIATDRDIVQFLFDNANRIEDVLARYRDAHVSPA